MKFRKKPVVIDAIQLTNELFSEDKMETLRKFLGAKARAVEKSYDGLFIHTLEGNMKADINDWIIIGVKGEVYPCKPDIFEQTYEKVRED